MMNNSVMRIQDKRVRLSILRQKHSRTALSWSGGTELSTLSSSLLHRTGGRSISLTFQPLRPGARVEYHNPDYSDEESFEEAFVKSITFKELCLVDSLDAWDWEIKIDTEGLNEKLCSSVRPSTAPAPILVGAYLQHVRNPLEEESYRRIFR